jgi:hypothetical protein
MQKQGRQDEKRMNTAPADENKSPMIRGNKPKQKNVEKIVQNGNFFSGH